MDKQTLKANDQFRKDSIKDLTSIVNKSLGLDQFCASEESSNFNEIKIETLSDTDTSLTTDQENFNVFLNSASHNAAVKFSELSCSKSNISKDTNSEQRITIEDFSQFSNFKSKYQISNSQKHPVNTDDPRNLECDLPENSTDVSEETEYNNYMESYTKEHCMLSMPIISTETNDVMILSSTYNLDKSAALSAYIPDSSDQSYSKYVKQSTDHEQIDITILKNATISQDINVPTLLKSSSDTTSHGINKEIIVAETNPDESFSSDYISEDDNEMFFSKEEKTKLGKKLFSSQSTESHGTKNRVCSHCFKDFKYPSHLRRHVHIHDVSYKNSSQNKQPSKHVRSRSKIKKSTHSVSDKLSSSKNELCSEKRNLQCPSCERKFRVPSKLIRHIKTHVGLKPHICNVCSKAFLEKFNLDAHMQIHREQKIHTCYICQKAFNFKSNFNRHIQRCSGKENPYICNKCGVLCGSKALLAYHKCNHEGKYKCNECGKRFRKNWNLKRHVEIHSNKTVYPSDQCK